MASSTHVLDKPEKTRQAPKAGSSESGGGPRRPPADGREPVVRREPFQSTTIFARLLRDRVAFAAVLLLGLMIVTSALGPFLSPYGQDDIDLASERLAPSVQHPFGTDDLGRDILLRTMLGGRVTLFVGIFSMLFALTIGLVAGAVAGYFGGIVDTLIMRTVDVALAVPIFLIVLLLSSALTPGLVAICALIGVTQWMEIARVARSVVLVTKKNDFVEAARALGVPDKNILFRHILSHTGGPVLVAATIALAQAIMLESAMSFLGYGVQPPAASWGAMLQNAQSYLAVAPWMAVFPGLMIFFAVLCCFTLGDFLRSIVGPVRR